MTDNRLRFVTPYQGINRPLRQATSHPAHDIAIHQRDNDGPTAFSPLFGPEAFRVAHGAGVVSVSIPILSFGMRTGRIFLDTPVRNPKEGYDSGTYARSARARLHTRDDPKKEGIKKQLKK